MEKSNVSEPSRLDKKRLESILIILFTNDKAILPGAVLSCLRDGKQPLIFCESRTLTQLRTLTLDNGSVVYKYVDSVKQHTEIFTGYCKSNTHLRAQ